MTLTGGMGAKKTEVLLEKLSSAPPEDPLMLVATGKFVGEGFDEPRLDTLFLAMPISWKGTLQQYAGRLHRLYDSKKEVQVYDYVDIHVPMLERMYGKRLKGYASIGYRAKGESISGAPADIIFNEQSFFEVYVNDIQNAKKEILIVSPFVMERRMLQIMPYFETCLASGIHIRVIVRPSNAHEESKQPVLNECFNTLSSAGVDMIFKPNIHQKFAVIDRKVVWYGSVNLLGFGRSKESMMRLVSGGIAHQLVMSINRAD
jgi:phosphatidylserine/phosphatidylglycerophosphate/cardiolipin synthase-like enzyme